METNIQRDWRQLLRIPGILAGTSFVAGILLGVGIAQVKVPRSCQEMHLRAHFLERKLGLDRAVKEPVVIDIQEPVERVRPAAPTEEAEAEAEAEIVVPTAPVDAVKVLEEIPVIEAPSTDSDFPRFGNAIYPVSRTPNWGAMKSAEVWNRSYDEMTEADFVRVPRYNLSRLMTPLEELKKTRDDPETIDLLTEKLFYSTRFFGRYNLDSGEFAAIHPGMDLKLPGGQPVASTAGGRVHAVIRSEGDLGLHVMIEHRIGNEIFYSIYGHLSAAWVNPGQEVAAGDAIGEIGSTGNSTGDHLHFQIDRGQPGETRHAVYWPDSIPSASEAAKHTMHPIEFISKY